MGKIIWLSVRVNYTKQYDSIVAWQRDILNSFTRKWGSGQGSNLGIREAEFRDIKWFTFMASTCWQIIFNKEFWSSAHRGGVLGEY